MKTIMTLDEFRATGRDCDDLGAALDDSRWDDSGIGKARGRLYLDGPCLLYIERAFHSSGQWLLGIGNTEWISDDLPRLEGLLYEFAVSEGFFE